MKRFLAIICIILLGVSLCSCQRKESGAGEVYYLNFKPEQDAQWQALAKDYTEETGVKVTVVTAAAGTYEDTLSAEVVKSNPPTLFQVNGPMGLTGWKNYCYDLSKTAVYDQLTDDDFALKDGDKVVGIAYAIETFGIIYNKALLDKYFALEGAKIKSLDEVKNFQSFKTMVEDIQSKKEALGIKGAFTSAGMDSSSDWRFKGHLANLPIYHEYTKNNINQTDAIKGDFLEGFRMIWDLYLSNSTVEPAAIGAKTGDDAFNEFNNGEAIFYQNGTWAWNDSMKEKIGAENVGMLPIYIGAEGEETQGLCTGSENYWCVNAKAGEKNIKATLDFMEWVVTSDRGTTALAEEMGFVSPFKKAKKSDNPLSQAADDYLAAGKNPVAWHFTTVPGENWKNGIGSALLSYAQGGQSDTLWDDVKNAFVNGWEKEYKANFGG